MIKYDKEKQEYFPLNMPHSQVVAGWQHDDTLRECTPLQNEPFFTRSNLFKTVRMTISMFNWRSLRRRTVREHNDALWPNEKMGKVGWGG